jgi:hypothetical protein
VTPDPNDPTEQAAFREADHLARIQDLARRGCACNCLCRQDDAMTTPLDLNDIE